MKRTCPQISIFLTYLLKVGKLFEGQTLAK